jgi:formylglycine-generating enzyme required for sulfatase activity
MLLSVFCCLSGCSGVKPKTPDIPPDPVTNRVPVGFPTNTVAVPTNTLLVPTNTLPPRTNHVPVDPPQTNVPPPVRPGMAYVPAGEFWMSIGAGEDKRRKIHVDAFFIDLTEVNNREYDRFIRDGGYRREELWSKDGWSWRTRLKIEKPRWWELGRYHIGPGFPNYPVAGVSWYEAEAFARWAGKRLPTEAEWEKASRGTDRRRFPWGEGNINQDGVFFANFETALDGHPYAAPVKAFPHGKSPYGCYNMLGNVWEWVADSWSGTSWYLIMPERNPRGDSRGEMRLMRGGSWFREANYYDSYFRLILAPGERDYDDIGFRCAADVK